MKDLFGVEGPDVVPGRSNESPYQAFKRHNRYRRSESKTERCKYCLYALLRPCNDKNYYKCRFMGSSSCGATDIALRNVCDKFQQEKSDI